MCALISYFSQTVHLLEQDDSIYCISAWNDLVICLINVQYYCRLYTFTHSVLAELVTDGVQHYGEKLFAN